MKGLLAEPAAPEPPSTQAPIPVTEIQPSRGWINLNLGELWRYRELLGILIWRDIKVRYKQTALGIVWVVLQPILTMIIFSVIFGRVAQLPSGGVPYPLFVFAALLPWQFFTHALNESGNSLVTNQQLITKVYFPRLIIPFAAVLSGLVDFLVAFVILMGLMLLYGVAPTIAIVSLPLFILLALMTASAIGLWLSILNVQYRDVRYTIPFLSQFWLFVTPVAYSSELVSEQWRWLFALNPMTGVVEGFRWALLGTEAASSSLILISAGVVLLLLISGLIYFRRVEDTFADMV